MGRYSAINITPTIAPTSTIAIGSTRELRPSTEAVTRKIQGWSVLPWTYTKAMKALDAVRFADEVGIAGRPFNDFASGGYLAWARFPRERVFIDGRTQAYPDDFFRFYFSVMDNPNGWPQVVDRFGAVDGRA